MSTHPNVILKCSIKAEGTTRKLLRDLLTQNRVDTSDNQLPLMTDCKGKVMISRDGTEMRQLRTDSEIAIGDFVYDTLIMESEYDEGMQISGQEGDLIIYDFVTYGYGEDVSWRELSLRVKQLTEWADSQSLEYEISVSANYW